MGIDVIRGDAGRIPLPDRSVDCVIGSPPYLDARFYREGGKGDHRRGMEAWISWMLGVTVEALRVSRGLVVWVCVGVTRNHGYQPGPEGLLYRWVAEGHGAAFRPVYWRRVGIPGSGHKAWYRADVEYCLAFKRPGALEGFADPTANGNPPRWEPGGAMSNRLSNGSRVNQSRKQEKLQGYNPPSIANPGNYFRTNAGGNQLGHKLAHESEAPYPVEVPAWFIRGHCKPGGIVLDPFAGSGTTGQAALESGRSAILCDLRQSQCKLSRKRCATVTPMLAGLEGA